MWVVPFIAIFCTSYWLGCFQGIIPNSFQAINFFSVQKYDVRSISRNCSVCEYALVPNESDVIDTHDRCVNNISQLLEHRNSYIFSNGCKQQLYVFQYILLEQTSDIQQLRVPPIYGTICMCCSHLASICVFGNILFSIPDPALV